MQNANQTAQPDPMDGLIQENQFVGWVYQMDYDHALILTRDDWKLRAKGVPLHCFLVAAAAAKKTKVPSEILLLRVTGPAELPQDDEAARGRRKLHQPQDDDYD